MSIVISGWKHLTYFWDDLLTLWLVSFWNFETKQTYIIKNIIYILKSKKEQNFLDSVITSFILPFYKVLKMLLSTIQLRVCILSTLATLSHQSVSQSLVLFSTFPLFCHKFFYITVCSSVSLRWSNSCIISSISNV